MLAELQKDVHVLPAGLHAAATVDELKKKKTVIIEEKEMNISANQRFSYRQTVQRL